MNNEYIFYVSSYRFNEFAMEIIGLVTYRTEIIINPMTHRSHHYDAILPLRPISYPLMFFTYCRPFKFGFSAEHLIYSRCSKSGYQISCCNYCEARRLGSALLPRLHGRHRGPASYKSAHITRSPCRNQKPHSHTFLQQLRLNDVGFT